MEKTQKGRQVLATGRDHLHIRGENKKEARAMGRWSGSPPHTWRKLTSWAVDKGAPRDHLHIRGENHPQPVQGLGNMGSPPHTWRKPISNAANISMIGITSTYVEKTIDLF